MMIIGNYMRDGRGGCYCTLHVVVVVVVVHRKMKTFTE